jgi:hypothetical protein
LTCGKQRPPQAAAFLRCCATYGGGWRLHTICALQAAAFLRCCVTLAKAMR